MRIVFLLLLSVIPAAAVGQIATRIPAPTPAECSNAIGTLRSGNLAVVDSQVAAGVIIQGCDIAGINALATAMRRRRLSTDVVEMNVFFTPSVADTALLAAALDIGTDRSASVAARVLGMGILLPYMGNADPMSYSGLVSAAEGDMCDGGTTAQPVFGWNNLPPNTAATIVSRVSSIEHDATQPVAVRSAVNCIMNVWRVTQALPVEPLVSFSAIPVSIEYICGTRFRIKNALPYPLEVQWSPVGTTTKSEMYARLRPAGQTYGASEFDSHAPRTAVQLFFDGQLVGLATPTGADCP